MMKTIALFGVIAAVSAQQQSDGQGLSGAVSPQDASARITSARGDLNVITTRSTSFTDIATEVSNMPTLIDAKVAQAMATMTDTAWRATMNATMEMTGLINAMQSEMAGLRAENAVSQSNMISTMEQMQSDAAAAAAVQAAELSTQQSTMVDNVEASLLAAETTVNATIASITLSVGAQLSSMNGTVTATLASKANTKKHIFVSYCPSHIYGNGWSYTCLNGVIQDTLAPYGRKLDNRWVRLTIAGWFRINSFGMGYSCNWNHSQIRSRIGGREFDLDYGHLYASGGWNDHHRDLTWLFVVNQDVTYRIYGQCNHISQHAGGREGSHQRFSVDYQGTRN